MAKSKIEWTDVTWNPITGCSKVSAGCKNCYAERIANRFWKDRDFQDIRFHPDRLEQPLHWKKPRRVFVCSMSDLFHPGVPDEWVDRIGEVVTQCEVPHTWIILTKRAWRMQEYFEKTGLFANSVWLGVTAENQKAADERIPYLLKTSARVKFVSVEPMLEEVDLSSIPYKGDTQYYIDVLNYRYSSDPDLTHGSTWCGFGLASLGMINWVICGAESGPGARPFSENWARLLKDQCVSAGVPFFFKQGRDQDGKLVKMPMLDGRVWDQYPTVKNAGA